MSTLPNPHSRKLPQKSFAIEPVHLRLGDICRKAILDGDFTAGERFPSERELAERYQVSRATANKVISTFVTEGLLELQKGIGARVRKRRTLFASLAGMESFTAQAKEQGLEPSTEVLTFERTLSTHLPKHVRVGLEIPKSKPESVVYLERLRFADGIPMILEYRWVRETLAPKLEEADVTSSFYRTLEEKYDLPITGERHTISAVLMGDEEAALFKEDTPAAVLQVEGTGFVRGFTPLWYQRLHYRADRYQLHNETRGPVASAIELRLQNEQPSV